MMQLWRWPFFVSAPHGRQNSWSHLKNRKKTKLLMKSGKCWNSCNFLMKPRNNHEMNTRLTAHIIITVYLLSGLLFQVNSLFFISNSTMHISSHTYQSNNYKVHEMNFIIIKIHTFMHLYKHTHTNVYEMCNVWPISTYIATSSTPNQQFFQGNILKLFCSIIS